MSIIIHQTAAITAHAILAIDVDVDWETLRNKYKVIRKSHVNSKDREMEESHRRLAGAVSWVSPRCHRVTIRHIVIAGQKHPKLLSATACESPQQPVLPHIPDLAILGSIKNPHHSCQVYSSMSTCCNLKVRYHPVLRRLTPDLFSKVAFP
jgi:hypothetical protein